MADRELRLAFRVTNGDKADKTFSSVDDAKTKVRFHSNWDWSKGTPSWTLEDSNKRLVCTWVFTEAQASDQLAVHNAIKGGDWLINQPTPGESDRSQGVPTIETAQCHYKAWNKTQ